MAEVVVEEVTKVFPSGRGIFNIHARFHSGSYNVILGPSGAGKSTLLRVIAGLESPDEGVVKIDGEDVTNLPPYSRSMAIVFQEPVLFPHLKVLDNIIFPLESQGINRNESIKTAMEVASLLSIEKLLDRFPDELSGGEKQRVSVARALITKPKVILLDEPYSNLDLSLRENLRWEIKKILREIGVTVIHVTHDQDEALELSEYLYIMFEGRIVSSGETREVYNTPRSVLAAKVLAHNILDTPKGCLIVPIDGFEVTESNKCGEEELSAELVEVRRRRGYILAIYETSYGRVKVSLHPSVKVPYNVCLKLRVQSVLKAKCN